MVQLIKLLIEKLFLLGLGALIVVLLLGLSPFLFGFAIWYLTRKKQPEKSKDKENKKDYSRYPEWLRKGFEDMEKRKNL